MSVFAGFCLQHLKNVLPLSTMANMVGTEAMASNESITEWAKEDNRRLLHVVYRVGDLDKTIKCVFQFKQSHGT